MSNYEKHVFHSPLGHLPYRLFRPTPVSPNPGPAAEDAAMGRRPMVVLLHGAGERGDDNQRPLVHGTADWVTPDRQRRDPSFVVVPQCPDDEVWASIERTHEPTVLAAAPSRPLRLVLQLLEMLGQTYPIDPDRVYLTGLSMGGYGVWDLLQRHPDHFAAAIPICGGADCRPDLLLPLQHKPLWVFHGDQDEVVPVARSREVVATLRNLGGNPRYTEYTDGDHDSWTATYRNPAVLDWLFSHQRSP